MSLFANNWPEWTRLYWLFCAPLALLLLWALYRVHQNQYDWRALLPPAFHYVLLNMDAPRQRHTRSIILGGAWLCALLALMGPRWDSLLEPTTQESQALPMVLVIQLTPDMLANDLPPSRLHQMREKVLRILEKREAAFTAIVVYAGSAHTLVPLSNDLLTSTNLLQALQPDLMPVSGQRADLAIARAIDLLQQGAQGAGEIILISNGVSVSEQNTITQQLKRHAIQLKIIGVGTLTGAPISQSAQEHFLTDGTGAVIISRLNQTSLQLLGNQTRGPYMQMSADDSDLTTLKILTQTDKGLTAALRQPATNQRDQGYWFILPILILVATFARRGSFLLILVCCLPMQSFAVDFESLWQRPDQQGAQLLEQQPALAAQRFTDPLWRATALYHAQDYQGAAKLFADFDSPAAHYNRGNALALAGQPAQALVAYQQALTLDPEMLAAQYNLAVVQAYLTAVEDSGTDSPETPASEPAEQASHSSSATTATTTSDISNDTRADDPSQGTPTQIEATQQHVQTSPQMPTTLDPHSTAGPQPPEPPQAEPRIHLESWLEQIPDNPSELLKRKFLYEQNMQETAP